MTMGCNNLKKRFVLPLKNLNLHKASNPYTIAVIQKRSQTHLKAPNTLANDFVCIGVRSGTFIL